MHLQVSLSILRKQRYVKHYSEIYRKSDNRSNWKLYVYWHTGTDYGCSNTEVQRLTLLSVWPTDLLMGLHSTRSGQTVNPPTVSIKLWQTLPNGVLVYPFVQRSTICTLAFQSPINCYLQKEFCSWFVYF